jgi:ribosome-binding protein aMBF1 (putative translation factor)
MATKGLISAEELFAEDMADPAYRAAWERTALARAVASAVVGYRIAHALSQTDLARQLGMKQPNVARLEAGDHNPSVEMLQRLSRALGLRFVLDVAPDAAAAPIALPAGLAVVQDVAPPEGGRVLVAAG